MLMDAVYTLVGAALIAGVVLAMLAYCAWCERRWGLTPEQAFATLLLAGAGLFLAAAFGREIGEEFIRTVFGMAVGAVKG